MTVPVALLDAGNGAVFAATLAVLISTVQWTLSSPWWKDPIGSTVVFKDLSLLVLLVPASLLLIWPHLIGPLGAAILVLCSTCGITIVLSWRCIVWYRIQRPWPMRSRNGGSPRRMGAREGPSRDDKDS